MQAGIFIVLCKYNGQDYPSLVAVPYALNVHYFSRPEKPKATIFTYSWIKCILENMDAAGAVFAEGCASYSSDMLGFGNSLTDWSPTTPMTSTQASSPLCVEIHKSRRYCHPFYGVAGCCRARLTISEVKQVADFVQSADILSGSTKDSSSEKILRALYEFSIVIRAVRNALQFADRHNIWPDAGFKTKLPQNRFNRPEHRDYQSDDNEWHH